ncbi:MAG TPA: FkbM family methyltransferase [Polyangiales bacterium]|jgi:FkbM family methyltransferase|nr:FkbM family methyltransferase [Polyangiales bacterium]
MLLAPIRTLRFLSQHPLTRDQPLAALVRYARWQLASRLAVGPIAVDFVDDARLLVYPGMAGATGNVYAGLHEFEDMAFVLHALRPSDLFIDVGANIGSYSVLAAKAVGAQVVAFEPIASTFRHLLDNLALNVILDRVDAQQLCVGREVGTVSMTNEQDSVNHVVSGAESSAQTTVPVTTLDVALAGRVPFMLKLDVEGYELEALHGASQTLANSGVQCLIVEINSSAERYGQAGTNVEALILSLGFTRCAYSPERRQLQPNAQNQVNCLFVRDIDLVQRRVHEAPRFKVLNREL